MNWFSIGLGIFALIYGFYSIYARVKTPEKFAKLQAMKDAFGPSAGTLVHTISYTVIPIFFGIAMIFAGIMGVAPFGK